MCIEEVRENQDPRALLRATAPSALSTGALAGLVVVAVLLGRGAALTPLFVQTVGAVALGIGLYAAVVLTLAVLVRAHRRIDAPTPTLSR